MSYDFSTLNDKDLEELVRDILSVKLSIDFQSFKPGQDRGIDLRYATVNDENTIIARSTASDSYRIEMLRQLNPVN
ncbi:MAG: hypothetical protein V4506_02640 [Bacteroidota bacterium]